MNRKVIYPFIGIAAIGGMTSCNMESKVKKMNVLYIMADDHTAQMMSCYDNRHVETPNLDRIAADGVKFTSSFVANSISGPSRACMLTGKHSHANGFYDNSSCVFDNTQQTLPKLMQKAGYQTAVVGKWHLNSLPTGFDFWSLIPGQGDYYNPRIITQQCDTIIQKGYLTNIITDQAIEWLESGRDKDAPFFMMVHHKAIHRNWMSDTTHLALFEDKVFEYPSNFYDKYEGRRAAAEQEMSISKDMDLIYDLKMESDEANSRLKGEYAGIYDRMDDAQRAAWDRHYNPIIEDFYSRDLKGRELDEWKYQRYMRDYSKTLKSLDENVGRLLDYLDEAGLSENTLVVYTSDQGFYMGEHGWFDKRFMYEESMHTPLVMRLPAGFDRRGDIDELVQNIDYAPTILELAGVDIPEDMHGISLMPLLRDEKVEWRDGLYYHFYEYPAEHKVKRHYGVRTDRYKLIHFYNDIDQWELYDLEADPTEMEDLYGKSGFEAITEELKGRIKEMEIEYGVTPENTRR